MRTTLRAVGAGLCACALVLGAVPDAEASSDHEQVVDLTFPTDPRAGGELDGGRGYLDNYDAERGSDAHKATDVMGEHGWPVYAAVGGTITFMPETEQSYGWMIRIRGTDGRRYSYVHLGRSGGTRDQAYAEGLSEGDEVERGQLIGYMGSSGNASASAPHLHFAIRDPDVEDPYGTSYLNPYPSLRAAEERGDYATDPDTADGPTGGDTVDGSGSDGSSGAGSADASSGGSGGGSSGATDSPSSADSSGDESGGDTEAGDPGDPEVDRVGGANRVKTAVALSQREFDSADHVVLASATSPPDALAAGPLAAAYGGPVLITRSGGLESAVIDELKRLDAESVTVVGGPKAVSAQTERELVTEAGLPPSKVHRIAGEHRYATAAAVADEVWQETQTVTAAVPDETRTVTASAAGEAETRTASVALGDHEQADRAWPDALMASYRGAVTGDPVLLVQPDGVPTATADALESVDEAVVIGGSAAVSEKVADAVTEHVDSLRRLAGADRFATAATVVEALLDAELVSPERVWAATGFRFPDALAAGPVVAHAEDTLVLVDGAAERRDRRLRDWLEQRAEAVADGRVIGGPAAVSEERLDTFAERIGGTG